ncbi:hypothetical protein [Neorhizobium sp. DAR64872/K0K18]|uniref:hypothetical protein n=1 Tax=Neorhizobium sp. DAR64872/K0K18 TaxID=3421958 RepID=UPI003D29DE1D
MAFEVVAPDPVSGSLVEFARVKRGSLIAGTVATVPFTIYEDTDHIEFRVLPTVGADVSINSIELRAASRKHDNSTDVPVWVLVTGTVRDELAVASKLRFLADLKSNGTIAQVVLSTWTGEYDGYPELKELIAANKFEIVQSPEPDLVCLGHFIHQMTALDNGLSRCPDDSFVLKTRTDKSGEAEGFHEYKVEQFLKRRDFAHVCKSTIHPQNFKIGLRSPYWEHSATGPSLCMWHDQTYFGYKTDLQRLVNFNVMSFDLFHSTPEQAFFGQPLLNKSLAFRSYFRAVDQYDILLHVTWNHSKSSDHKIEEFSSRLVQNKLFRDALLAERLYMAGCFFNLDTNQDLSLDLTFRGHDLMSYNETGSDLEEILRGRDPAADYRIETAELQALFLHFFGIGSRNTPSDTSQSPYLTTTLPKKIYNLKR